MSKQLSFWLRFGLAIFAGTFVLLCDGTVKAAQPSAETGLPALARVQSERMAAVAATHSLAPAYEAAPMPNIDAHPPRAFSPSRGAAIEPTMYPLRGGYRGDGFTPGSSPQVAQQSHRISLPGINWKMPLN